ncbi:MAG: glycosyltransferase [Candidatus Moranbacteria bacterium]|nr:glycosyltransferase [Candidatus Moranbacteria bacterium]
MKIISILFGKVVGIVKNEGLISGLSMFLRGLFQISKMMVVRRGEILFVASGASGASTLHRVFHIAEELKNQKFKVSIIHQSSPLLQKQAKRFQVFIFHHATKTEKLEKFISKLEKNKKTIIFETDDLTFEKQIFQKTNAYKNLTELEKKQYEENNFLLENSAVKFATTTTTYLAERLKKYNKKVFVIPNKLSEKDLSDAKFARRNVKKNNEKITIGYFSGSKSHDRDFAVVSDVLLRILKENKNVQLYLVGALEISKKFEKYENQITRKSLIRREKYFHELAKCDVTIAPLEVGDPFCESKSELKFFESAIVKNPVVVSGTQTFQESIQDGKDGFIASDLNEWYKKLITLIQNKNLREKMGRQAFETALQKYTTSSKNKNEYYNFLKNAIDEIQEINLVKSENLEIDTVVVIANWNGKKYLETCFQSLQSQTDQNFQIILVDNGSTDDSVNFIKNNFPQVSIIRLKKNTGFANPNNIGMRMAFLNPNIKYIITLNNDVKADENYIKEMRTAIQKYESDGVMAIQPKLMNFYEKNKIDATGILTTFELSAVNRGRGEFDNSQFEKFKKVFGPSASAALYTRKFLEKVDLSRDEYFDKNYFAYYEDVDLAWRLHLAGCKMMYVPTALLYHVHSATGINYSPFKAFHIHRNHYFNIIKNVPFFSLIKILLFMPIRYILLVLSVVRGSGASAKIVSAKVEKVEKSESVVKIVFRSWWGILINLPMLLRKRKLIQKNCKISNREFKKILKENKVSIVDVIFRS